LKKEKIISLIKKFITLIGILILTYLILDIGVEDITNTFLSISPIYLIFAILLTIPRVLVRGYAWQIILKKHKIKMSYIDTIKIFLIGYFYASITPGYAGHLIRVPYLKEKTNEPLGKLTTNTFIETITHTLSLYGMMSLGAILIISEFPEIFPITIIFVSASIAVYIILIKRERGEKIFHFLVKYLIPKKHKISLTKFVDSFYNDFPRLRDLAVPFFLGIITWIIIFSQIYIIGLSLGIDVLYHYFILLYAIANVVSFIPITFSGFGTRDVTVVALLSIFDVQPATAITISISGHIITDLLTGLYGLIISIFEVKSGKKEKITN
jgi:uncharacterized protein (TIRG00374 family)